MNKNKKVVIGKCTRCGYEIFTTERIYNALKPKKDDIVICYACAAVHLVDIKLDLRLMTQEEELELAAREPELHYNLARLQFTIQHKT